MPKPYPLELRQRAVEASDTQGVERAAVMFDVGPATLKRWRARRRATGSSAASPMGGDRRSEVARRKRRKR